MATSLGTWYGNNAGPSSNPYFKVGVSLQYTQAQAGKGYYVQYKYFIYVLRKASTQKYFTQYMRVSWSSNQYACGDVVGEVASTGWKDAGWIAETGSYTVPAISCHYYYTNSDIYKSERASFSVAMPGRLSSTITYNANGGSGAPAAQTKYSGTNITLSTTKPTRTGYTFRNWNTAANGSGTSYSSGATFTSDENTTLYAQWDIIKYTISYNANGGSGAPSSQQKEYGKNITLSNTKPTRAGYEFQGWSTSATGGVQYSSGSAFAVNANTTLYAVWKSKSGLFRLIDGNPRRVVRWRLINGVPKKVQRWRLIDGQIRKV